MMANKWMQTGIFFGIAIGMMAGCVLTLVHPLLSLGAGYSFGFLSMWWAGNAKGTDGWGGPWHGPRQ